ncbi:MAG TPA: DUF4190 domain-containing protein [Microbacteriaceae bacterium]|nr:DUF4190 domain-containing protein [Microbacteriaceae bacterium]
MSDTALTPATSITPDPAPSPQQASPIVPLNVVAVAALAVAFLSNIAGVILGILALREIRRTSERGQGLAIAAIIISVLSIVFSLLVALWLIAIGSITLDQIGQSLDRGGRIS